MAEFSYPFDGGSGAILTEDDWSEMARNWQDDGVITSTLSALNLRLGSLSEPNTIILNPGAAIVQGFMYRNTDELDLTFSTNTSGNPRIDRIVLRLDRTTNSIQAVVKEGTPAASPVAPTLNTTYPIYEISLAIYTVNAGASTVSVGAITADRPIASRYIRVSTAASGHPHGSIVWNPDTNAFSGVNSSGALVSLGSSAAPAAAFVVKTGVGTPVSGASAVIDAEVRYTLPTTGRYRVSGEAYYLSDASSATAVFSLTGPTSTGIRGVFRHISSTTNVVHTTSSSFSGGCSIGTPASSTIYAVSYDFILTATATGEVAIRTSTHSGSSEWQIRSGSYMRVEIAEAV